MIRPIWGHMNPKRLWPSLVVRRSVPFLFCTAGVDVNDTNAPRRANNGEIHVVNHYATREDVRALRSNAVDDRCRPPEIILCFSVRIVSSFTVYRPLFDFVKAA